MKYGKFLAVVVCLIVFSLSALAQPPRNSAKAKSQEEQKEEQKMKELEQKALAMLDELIADGQSLRLPENRVRILAAAGDMLWRQDEKRARELFIEATKILTQLIHQPEDSPEALPENIRWQIFGWRQELAQLIARNDAQLALDFLSATRFPNGPTNNAEQETQLEIMLAQQIIQQDPKRALAIAKEKLATATNLSVVGNLIYSLREKDFASAQELTESILTKLRAEGQLKYDSATFAINLLGMATNPDDNGEASSEQPKSLISPAVARELIEKILASAQAELAKAKGQVESNQRYNAVNLLNNLKSSMPFIEKYAPGSVPALKRILPEADKLKDFQQRRWDDLNELASKGSADLLIEVAAKAPAEMQYSYYQRASQIAREKGDIERARQIIKDNVSDINQQRQALREIDQQTMWQRINEGKFEEAKQLIAGTRSDVERINALVQMAMNAHNGGKKELAIQFLEEAAALVGVQVESSQMFNSQMQIAGAFIQVNPVRSFEVLEATLDQFNELLEAASLIESFQQQGSFRQKEMVLNTGGAVSQYLPQYAQHLSSLARNDLRRVQAAINRFARPEARIAVRLLVLQQLLRSQNGVYAAGKGGRLHLMSLH